MCLAFGCCQKLRLLASICFQIPTNFSSSWHRSNFSLLDFNRLPTVKFLVIVDFSRFRPFLYDSMHFAFLIITPFRVGAQKCILAPSRSIYPNTHFSSPPQKHLCRGRNRHNRHNRHNRNMWFLHHEIQPPKT